MFASARKPELKAKARDLRRREGTPVRRIAAELGVAKSTVSLWVCDINLSREQRRRNWEAHQGKEAQRRRSERRSAICRNKRRLAQLEGRRRARNADPLHMAGCMLYWAEGAKSRNDLVLANSDVAMITFFVKFLCQALEVEREAITIRLNVYLGNGRTIGEVEEYWVRELDLPRSALRKHMIDHFPTSSSGSKRNKLPYGVCTLRVLQGTPLVQHIFGAIQEYAGFEEPRWLG